jgi:ElaA protein
VFTWRRAVYRELDRDDLYDALALRCQAFIVEQVPYLDPDGVDRQAHHLLGRAADGALVAYLRIVDPGAKYAEPSIGRVVVARAARGGGWGRALMVEGIAYCSALWPGRPIRIGAQAHLRGFYTSLGFEAASDPYDEDGILHLEMLRNPA